jgi:hypothetical protein
VIASFRFITTGMDPELMELAPEEDNYRVHDQLTDDERTTCSRSATRPIATEDGSHPARIRSK